jgi:DNA-binding transcriptional MerR regulator
MTLKRTEEITHDEGLPRQALYYMENKGYIKPLRKRVGRRVLREYTESDIELAKLIWKYHEEDGLIWDAAYEKASTQLELPNVL